MKALTEAKMANQRTLDELLAKRKELMAECKELRGIEKFFAMNNISSVNAHIAHYEHLVNL